MFFVGIISSSTEVRSKLRLSGGKEWGRSLVYVSLILMLSLVLAFENLPPQSPYLLLQIALVLVQSSAVAVCVWALLFILRTANWTFRKVYLPQAQSLSEQAPNSMVYVLLLILIFAGSIPGLVW